MIRDAADAAWGDGLHRRFRALVGSDVIASGFALGAIRTQVRRRRPRAVLEVGAGIGAITAGLAETLAEVHEPGEPPAVQVAVEDVAFCLEQLGANLGGRRGAVTVVDQVRHVPASFGDFELVIVDGGAVGDLLPAEQHRWSAADEQAEIAAWAARLAPEALVLVENRRDPQRSYIEAQARARGRRFVHEHVRPLDGSPGVHAYWFDPAPTMVLAARGRELLRRAWFPHGIRTWRRVRVRLGRPPVDRDTVAPGDPAG